MVMNFLHRSCIILSFFWTALSFSQSPSVYFNRLTMENGLSHNCVNKAIEDKNGFIWFATSEGLNRYDGKNFKSFTFSDSGQDTTPVSSFVSLMEDDSGLFWVGTISGLYIFNPQKETFIPMEKATADGKRITDKITDIAKGKDGDIWIADYSHGIFRYNTKRDELKCYCSGKGTLAVDEVLTICCDNDSTIWAGTIGYNSAGLNRFDEKTDSFVLYNTLYKSGVNKIVESSTNDLLIGTPKDGVFTFNRVTGESDLVFTVPDKDMFVNDILVAKDKIWIGTGDGLYVYDRKTADIRVFKSDLTKKNTLSSNEITSILKDHNGGLWFCTLSRGVNYLPDNYNDFELYPCSYGNGFNDGQIKSFAQDNDGNVWFATDKGLVKFSPKTRSFNQDPLKGVQLSGKNINLILINDNTLWVGYMGKGLDEIDLKTHNLKKYPTERSDTENALNDNSIMSLFLSSEGNMLVGTTRGANEIHTKSGVVDVLITRDNNELISDIIEDDEQNFWMSCYNNGIYWYNPRTKKWSMFRHTAGDPDSLCGNQITGLFKDSKGNVWIHTEGKGICRYDDATQRFTSYTTEDGLPNDVIEKVLEDNSGKIWISTNNGLSCFDPANECFTNYSFAGGPLSNQFLHQSGMKDHDGFMYFGTSEGFLRFRPESLNAQQHDVPIFFTDLFIDNQCVKVGGKGASLDKSIVCADKIVINHRQNSIRLSFAELDWCPSRTSQFCYKLENYDSDWIPAHDNQIYYSNLPSGKYRLTIINAKNIKRADKSNSRSVTIIVKPSPWLGRPACLAYLVLGLAVIFLIIKSLYKRQTEKKKRMMEELKADEEKAVYDTKLAFFTGIAHEIRTPLSLIVAPFEIISSPKSTEEEKASCIDVIKENLNRLTELTRQMLDLSIIEQEGFILNKVPTDINDLVETVLKSFRISLQRNEVHIEKQLCEPHVIASVDKEEFIKIVSNLLSNAAKYCKGNIKITLEKEDNIFRLKVWNNGSSIEPEFREKIFETFYQVPGSQKLGGVGVGLSLVKKFVGMHNGSVYVNPETESGTEMVVEIPLGNNDIEYPEERTEKDIQDEDSVSTTSKKASVMVVDDNKSMVRFLKKLLGRQFRVITAEDGTSAISMLRQHPIDLMISDVMMSDLDGISLCRLVKNHDEFKHIPVILLTAKTDLESKVAGIDAGAEAYIEKPFSAKLLIAQINNILTNKRVRKKIAEDTSLKIANEDNFTAKDEMFVKKLYETINNNLSDQNLDVNFLSEKLHISRSNLYRKIKETTGMSPGELIKDIRLEKAATMLSEGKMRINEIKDMVGYSSSSYFAKNFLKKYGVLPKDYIKKQ